MNRIQQALKIGFDGIIGQECKSSINGIQCVYRDGNGNKCAVGHLIADSQYNPEFNRKPLHNQDVVDALVKSGWPEIADESNTFYNAMLSMQRVHDNEPMHMWPLRRDELIKEYA